MRNGPLVSIDIADGDMRVNSILPDFAVAEFLEIAAEMVRDGLVPVVGVIRVTATRGPSGLSAPTLPGAPPAT